VGKRLHKSHVSYAIRQVVYTINTGTNGSAAQGVQQPYEISVVTAIEEVMDISIEMVVFPNPATDFVKLRITMTFNNI